MPAAPGAEKFLPDIRTVPRLREAARTCEGCALFRDATQTVFGAGPVPASMLLIGEQPGDKEDRAGEPFVGPAGRLLDKALTAAGIDRDDVYVTNAVKHFKFTRPEGKRRLHKTPGRTEVVACRPWLLAEIDAVRPRVIVALGATAAQSLMGPDFRMTRNRGELLAVDSAVMSPAPPILATAHPSSVLRAPDDKRDRAMADLVDDLATAAKAL